MTMLSGASMIYGPGMLDSGMVMDLGQIVADADLINMLQFAQKGLSVNDDKLALDVIREIGIKGEYLSCQHTFANFKTEQSVPFVFCRDSRDEWITNGAPNAHKTASARAKAILDAEPKKCVSEDAAAKMAEIIAKVEAEWQ